MPEWQGRCDRCGAFIRVDRRHSLGRFDERHGRLCGCCAIVEGVTRLARRKPQKRVRVLRRVLHVLLANRDSRPISVTDHINDVQSGQRQ